MSKKSVKEAARTARAQELMAQRRKAEARRRNLTIGGVVLVLLLLAGGLYLLAQRSDSGASSGGVLDKGATWSLPVGKESAPKHVVVYEDFLCPACGQLEASTHEQLAEDAAAGKVFVEYRPFELINWIPGNDYSKRATAAFASVLDREGTETAKKFHDLLFANQPSEQEPPKDNQWLAQLAGQAGADQQQVLQDLEDGTYDSWVDDATAYATEKVGVEGTPTVYIDGEIQEGSLDQMAESMLADSK